jgi:hypothetical protein
MSTGTVIALMTKTTPLHPLLVVATTRLMRLKPSARSIPIAGPTVVSNARKIKKIRTPKRLVAKVSLVTTVSPPLAPLGFITVTMIPTPTKGMGTKED